jgi:G-protein signaling modulator 2
MYCFRENLELMRELNERAAQGRACGNLGNTYYLLGNFQQAIHYHEEVSYIEWDRIEW